MPDISMCQNTKCLSHTKCYRFTATPNELWQSYAEFKPIDGEDRCSHYWNRDEYTEGMRIRDRRKKSKVSKKSKIKYLNNILGMDVNK